MSERITFLTDGLQVLTKPRTEGNVGHGKLDLESILLHNIQATSEILNLDLATLESLPTLIHISAKVSSKHGIKWQYSCLCLHLMLELQDAMNMATKERSITGAGSPTCPPPDILSVQQQKTIQIVMQFIVTFGVLPYLLPGVGVPMESRSGFGSLAQGAREKNVSEIEKYERLVSTTRGLLQLLKNMTLGGLIVSRHFGDFLAAMTQLAYAPLKKPEGPSTPKSEDATELMEKLEITENSSTNTRFVMTEELWNQLQKDKCDFQNHLQKVLDKIYQPVVVRELIQLQGVPGDGAGKKSCHAPAWLRKTCGMLLSERLMKQNGLVNVIRGILDGMGDNRHGPDDWKNCESVAKVIATPPQGMSPGDYYKIICPQVIVLLHSEDRNQAKMASLCTRAISDASHIVCKREIFDVMMGPLLCCCIDDEREDPPVPLKHVTETAISQSVKCLHRCFSLNTDSFCLYIMKLSPVVHALFEIHCAVRFGVSHLKQGVYELLMLFLKHSEEQHRLKVLSMFAFGEEVKGVKMYNTKLQLLCGDEAGVKVVERLDGDEESWFVADDQRAVCLVDLVTESNNESLLTDFFLMLLNQLTLLLSSHPVDETQMKGSDTAQELLRIEQEVDNSLICLRRSLMVIRLLGLLSENDLLQQVLLKSPTQTITFIQATLDRAALLCEDEEYKEAGFMQAESVTMAMGVMGMLISQGAMSSHQWELMKRSLEPLRILVTSYPDNRVQSMAEELRVAIATHGAVKTDTSNTKKEVNGEMNPQERKNQHISNAETNYQQVINDLSDPLLPTRGHALLQLSKLTMAKDPETLKNREAVLKVFQENLEQEDSYLYLMAIQGMSALGDLFPAKVLELLTAEFAQFPSRRNHFQESCVELRMKIGEALVRIVRSLGELAPHHKAPLLNAFLVGAKDNDASVRASALSNLGELCSHLNYSLGGAVQEVFVCLSAILTHDPSIEVRRAAVLVVALTIRGLGNNVLKVLEDILPDLYHTLKELSQNERDDILRSHARVSLTELDKAVKGTLFPDQKLEKQIHVLHPPSH